MSAEIRFRRQYAIDITSLISGRRIFFSQVCCKHIGGIFVPVIIIISYHKLFGVMFTWDG